jgi:alpha-1,6-mannosyltransferase
MNELTRTGLRGLDLARRGVQARPAVTLALAGFAAGALVVVAGGRVGTGRTVIPLTDWLHLLWTRRQGDSYLPAALLVCGIVALLLLWLVAIRLHHAGAWSERSVWCLAAAWAAPFAIGPPVLSNDVWRYAAQGLLQRRGLDPYSVGASALGNVHAVAAVDPTWRSVPSSDGPLATTVQHLAVAISGGSPLGAVIVFRALGLACFVAIGVLVAELAGSRRVEALTLTVLNPLLLLHVISGAHLEGVLSALLLGAVVAAHQRSWVLAIVLGCAAGSIKAPALVAVAAIIAVHHGGFRGAVRWRVAVRDVVVAVVSVLALAAIVRNGWGWLQSLNPSTLGHTPLAPASLIADLYDPLITAASFDDLAAGGRITTMLAAACIVVYLTVTAHRRALPSTVGYDLLAIGLLGPVLYPWSVLAGVVCLGPTSRGERRDWIVLVSAVACMLDLPGLSPPVSVTLTLVGLGLGLAWLTGRDLARRRAAATPARTAKADGPAPDPASDGSEITVGG